MARRFILRKNVKHNLNADGVSHNNVVYRTPDVVDEFYFEEVTCSDDDQKAIGVTDPTKMLFAQERIINQGNGMIEAWLDSLRTKPSDPLADLRAKCSDKELKALIKSRHIQQPCEIVSWAQQCEYDMKDFSESLKQLRDQQLQTQQSTQQVEPISNSE